MNLTSAKPAASTCSTSSSGAGESIENAMRAVPPSDVLEQRRGQSQRYTNLVRVVMTAEGEEIEVSGTTVGPEHRLFLAEALGYAIDIELGRHMAFLSYDDVPGVIGKVGTMFGEAGVNIANMAVSRTSEGGTALMAFSIDSPAPPELVEHVEAAGFADVRFISFA